MFDAPIAGSQPSRALSVRMLMLDSSQPWPGSLFSGNHQACWAATIRGSRPRASFARCLTFPLGDSMITQCRVCQEALGLLLLLAVGDVAA